jgi:hypothetical protein
MDKGLGLIAIGLLGVIDVSLEVLPLKDSPVNLVQIVKRSEIAPKVPGQGLPLR